jgi:hypothetical protein
LDTQTAGGISRHFRQLLESIVAVPEYLGQPLPPGAEERKQALLAFNDPAVPFQGDELIRAGDDYEFF